MKSIALFLFSSFLFLIGQPGQAQLGRGAKSFTHQDTLRGTVTPERAWWDVSHYTVTVQPSFNTKTIKGSNEIRFTVLQAGKDMQIDLQQPMNIDTVTWDNKAVPYTRDGNVFLLHFPVPLQKGSAQQIRIAFSGKPREAVNPPWDGGWIWKKDLANRPWMTVACQGLGASVWYPCKDHQSDEPDSALLSMIVPDTLVGVGNGRLYTKTANGDGTTTYTWGVKNPINNYTIIPYIGKYENWTETFNGEKGPLDCSYWVLDYNVDKAKEQFKQTAKMLSCFEHWFGPYPFYEDSYKLVEAPHLGMEHQSAVAYGNKFANGYLGRDLSSSGWGLKWDYILVHESGHEWFGNNITSKDIGDMWIHESFTDYSETLYTECEFGKEAATDYVAGLRRSIQNRSPIIGPYGVNAEGSGDMYNKGANMIHTIRQVINNDDKFRNILRGLNQTFYHQTVTAKQIEEYISKQAGIDFSKVFDQYLLGIQIPALEYKLEGGKLSYRYTNCVPGFNMPLKVSLDGEKWLKPTDQWQTMATKASQCVVDINFYVNTLNKDSGD
ncbi:MAG: M1 family metallopeptidase [Williamsia sp.]|nr:M1 family metallopeptidase [Williamsia sp.]